MILDKKIQGTVISSYCRVEKDNSNMYLFCMEVCGYIDKKDTGYWREL